MYDFCIKLDNYEGVYKYEIDSNRTYYFLPLYEGHIANIKLIDLDKKELSLTVKFGKTNEAICPVYIHFLHCSEGLHSLDHIVCSENKNKVFYNLNARPITILPNEL